MILNDVFRAVGTEYMAKSEAHKTVPTARLKINRQIFYR